ncbi:hypothetical protein MJ585_08145 [Klebsiella pneumoniae]|nr:hypothetical protein MJ585_08145 [Klebsiella pneumoniae]
MLHSEVSIPFDYLVNQNLTLGSEEPAADEDNASNTRALSGGEILAMTAPAAARTRRRKSSRCSLRTTWS